MSIEVNVNKLTEKLFENFKKFTPALLAISLFSGAILFLPEKILKKMALDNLPKVWDNILGIVFILSIALIISILVSQLTNRIVSKHKKKKLIKRKKEEIQKLSLNQKAILHSLLHSRNNTISLDSTSGDTVFLLNNLFIYQPQQSFCIEPDNTIWLKYTPQAWLIQLYNEDPDFFSCLTS